MDARIQRKIRSKALNLSVYGYVSQWVFVKKKSAVVSKFNVLLFLEFSSDLILESWCQKIFLPTDQKRFKL